MDHIDLELTQEQEQQIIHLLDGKEPGLLGKQRVLGSFHRREGKVIANIGVIPAKVYTKMWNLVRYGKVSKPKAVNSGR